MKKERNTRSLNALLCSSGKGIAHQQDYGSEVHCSQDHPSSTHNNKDLWPMPRFTIQPVFYFYLFDKTLFSITKCQTQTALPFNR